MTDPFKLGLYYRAYQSMGSIRSATLNVLKRDPRDDEGFAHNERFYYDTQEKLRKSMGLSEDDICHALADNDAATCKALAPP